MTLAIEAIDARRADGRLQRHEAVQPHEPASLPRHVELTDRRRVVPVRLGKPQLHGIVVIDGRIAEARDFIVAADHQAQSRGDVLGVDAQVRRTRAVDARLQFGAIEPQRRVGVDEAEAVGVDAQVLRAF